MTGLDPGAAAATTGLTLDTLRYTHNARDPRRGRADDRKTWSQPRPVGDLGASDADQT
jgi:hypothetical protein